VINIKINHTYFAQIIPQKAHYKYGRDLEQLFTNMSDVGRYTTKHLCGTVCQWQFVMRTVYTLLNADSNRTFFSLCFNDWQCNALQVRFRAWRALNSLYLLTYLLTYLNMTFCRLWAAVYILWYCFRYPI